MGIRSLAPRVYEGGWPEGPGGEKSHSTELPQSACSADSPLLKAGAEVGVKMYLSIGNDMSVRDSSIIGIFDLDNTTINARGREFLERAEKEGQVVPCDDLPKTFVLTAEYGLTRLYLSSLNTSTLEKRMK